MSESRVRFSTFPRTEAPPRFIHSVVNAFYLVESLISTTELAKGLNSDSVLQHIRPELVELGFEVESGKQKGQKIDRPVFFSENGVPELKYEID